MRRSLLMSLVLVVGLILAACGATVEEKSPPPPTRSLSFPSVVAPGGAEDTKCVLMRLGNPTPIHVGAIHNTLGRGAHHMVLYRVSDTEERTTPFSCTPFIDTLDPTKGSPLMVTQKEDDLLTLPPGVAYSFEANQMLRIEMHYINPSHQDRPMVVTTTMIPMSEDDFRDEADFVFIGNPDISIAPHSTAVLGPSFMPLPEDLAGVKFFAITGHAHQLGTNVQVATATSSSDEGKMVYDVPDWRWNEPKTEVYKSPLVIPDGGGFKFTCTWNNPTDDLVKFGESTKAEMCFFWAYYYPSRGAKVCVHSTYTSPEGSNLCCPGHPVCLGITDLVKKLLDRDKAPVPGTATE